MGRGTWKNSELVPLSMGQVGGGGWFAISSFTVVFLLTLRNHLRGVVLLLSPTEPTFLGAKTNRGQFLTIVLMNRTLHDTSTSFAIVVLLTLSNH